MPSRSRKPKMMRRLQNTPEAPDKHLGKRNSQSTHKVTLTGFDNIPISETEMEIFERYLPEILGQISGSKDVA